MATVILHPQDLLRSRLHHQALLPSPPLKVRRSPNSDSNWGSNSSSSFNHGDTSRSSRRKRNSVKAQPNCGVVRDRSRSREASVVVKLPAKNLVMGQVKILKRGENLTTEISNRSLVSKSEDVKLDSGLGSIDRLGPDPDMMQKQVMVSVSEAKVIDGVYAGSGIFFSSPPPSSVPLPSFLGMKGSATTNSRNVLGLVDSD